MKPVTSPPEVLSSVDQRLPTVGVPAVEGRRGTAE
jgi:hypothetical protein